MKSISNHGQVVVVLNNALPNCSPKGTTIMYFTSLYFGDCFEKALTKENYFDLKDRLAKQFIETFEKATNTNIHDYIEEIEVGTPLTYAHYTDAPDGTIYGYLTENGEVSGAILASGTTIKTKHIVSNAMPVSVYGKMVDKKDVPLWQVKKANFNKLAGRGF